MFTIENDFIVVCIHPVGAELQHLYNKQTNSDILWSGDATYWGKYSPVLFPIVGSLKDNTYYYKNKSYQLPRHGFAREKIFTVKNKTETSITLSLTYDETTLKVYPFYFELEINYSLNDQELNCIYNVKNIGKEEMYFSIGAHPAFAIDDNYEDYFLQFNKDEKLIRYKLENGLISDTTETIPLEKNKLNLQHSLFYEDAIVLKNLESTQITLTNKKTKNGFQFKFKDFPFFGIWAAKNAPFVCLEPWCGIADGVNHNQQLIDKEGIIGLNTIENFSRSWCFTIVS